MKTYVSPSFINQLARQIGQSESIKLSFALDKAVRQYGYSNYRNYLNLLEEGREAKRDLLKKVALERIGPDCFKKGLNLNIQQIILNLPKCHGSCEQPPLHLLI